MRREYCKLTNKYFDGVALADLLGAETPDEAKG